MRTLRARASKDACVPVRMHKEIASFLQTRIDAGDFPSAVYLVAEKGEIVFQEALGFAVVEPERIEARLDTIYDLASLTKPLVTGLLCSKLAESGTLDLNDNVARILSDNGQERGGMELTSLASHVSGLPGWLPFYLLSGAPEFDPDDYGVSCTNNDQTRSFVLHRILSSVQEAKPSSKVIYSDLNFLLLGFLVEEMCGLDLATAYSEQVVDRLSLQRTAFWGGGAKPAFAASEKGNEYEKQTCIEQGYLTGGNATVMERAEKNPPAHAGGSDLFRDYQIWGEVHDGNAWFMGGVAGHAGLFSTAEEVFRIAQQFLPNYTQLLKPETCELFRTNFTKGMNEARSIAFQLAETPESTAGTRMSPESFGHNGFTGTSLWIDPVKERIFILLTNRTHHHELPFVNINSVRRRFHDLAVDLLDKNS